MLSETVAIKVKTKEEYREVIRYYRETEGWRTGAMNEHEIDRYPNLFLWDRRAGIISGHSNADNFDTVLTFGEWEDLMLGEIPAIQPDLKLLFGEAGCIG